MYTKGKKTENNSRAISDNRNNYKGTISIVDNRPKSTLQKMSQKSNQLGTAVIQMENTRAANPYEQADSHKGYELTAHHIIPHSKLMLAEKLLIKNNNSINNEILKASIPNRLTVDQIIKIGIFKSEDKAKIDVAWISKIEEALKGTIDGNFSEANQGLALNIIKNISNITINDQDCNFYRQCFYEWQGGNQFMGPNTDFREEPGDKDDIDFDAQWIMGTTEPTEATEATEPTTTINAVDFEKLTGLKQDKFQKISTPNIASTDDVTKSYDKDGNNDKGLGLELLNFLEGKAEDSKLGAEEVLTLKNILEKILNITVNRVPQAFNAEKWKEISEEEDFDKLMNNQPFEETEKRSFGRNREGVINHTFYILEISQLSSCTSLKVSSGSSSTAGYSYEGTDIEGSKQKGTYIYFPVKNADKIMGKPTVKQVPLIEELKKINALNEKEYKIMEQNELEILDAGTNGYKFTITGFKMDPIFINKDRVISKKNLDKLIGIETPNSASSLKEYCAEKGIKYSTYIPKGLYDWLKKS